MNSFHHKKVLVAGGTGLIGTFLVELLLERCATVKIVSLDDKNLANQNAEFLQLDLTDFENCRRVCRGMDYVFNLLCVKGSPATVRTYPATLFDTNLLLDVNLLRAAQIEEVRGFLITSSLAVYAHSQIAHEDSVWNTFPSENDRFAAWAKRMGELQAEAYRIEYGWNRISIARPANTYGPFDDFESEGAMVVPSIIRRVVCGENPLHIRGDGSEVRDFIHARDVARGMLMLAEQEVQEPVNLGSGRGVSIRELVSCICDQAEVTYDVVWDTSHKAGDKSRVLNTNRARSLGFNPTITLESGIRETIEWYRNNRCHNIRRFDSFKNK